jgi:peptidoglycan/xylan/chitin deacetylase (PgdA/CDA1 family)
MGEKAMKAKVDRPGMNVVLSFDLDGETLWLSKGKGNYVGPVILSQGRYGPLTAVPRILQILEKYGIHSTFFVPGWIAEKYPAMCASLLEGGHEIGHHGYLHEWPNVTTADEEVMEFEKGFESLMRVTGLRPKGWRAPGWEFSNRTMKLLLDYKFKYSSNMMDTEKPYEHIVDGRRTGLVELPVSWVLDDASHFMYAHTTSGWPIQNAWQVYEIWKDEFDGMYEAGDGETFILTMHPQIIGRHSRLMMLERLICHIRSRPGVNFCTCDKIASTILR